MPCQECWQHWGQSSSTGAQSAYMRYDIVSKPDMVAVTATMLHRLHGGLGYSTDQPQMTCQLQASWR